VVSASGKLLVSILGELSARPSSVLDDHIVSGKRTEHQQCDGSDFLIFIEWHYNFANFDDKPKFGSNPGKSRLSSSRIAR
jgi:hypothetical protein